MSAEELPHVNRSVVVVQQDESDYFLVNLERGDSVAIDRADASVFESCRKGATMDVAARALAEALSAKEEDVLPRMRTAFDHFRQWGLCTS